MTMMTSFQNALARTGAQPAQTGNVELRLPSGESKAIEPNTVTLMIEADIPKATVSAHLLDADTGRELTNLPKIELDIPL